MIRLTLLLAALSTQATAQDLALPGNATLAVETTDLASSYDLPTGPFANGTLPADTTEGTVTQQAWTLRNTGLTTGQLLIPLRDQLLSQGFEIIWICNTTSCGGFDFRFATPVLPPPAMFVDLGDFRFLSARRDAQVVSVLTSRTARAGYVQITTVGTTATTQATAPSATPASLPTDFARALDTQGHITLSDLRFEIGAATLAPERFASLQSLADYLAAQPDRTVALVGHTDATGSLDGNIALSRRRATAVMDRLIADYGTNAAQLEAQGMGYLAPIATNLTEDGRTANRRVEVIVTSTP